MYNFLPINITDFKGMAKLHCIFTLFQPLLARIDVIWEKQPLEKKPALGPQCDSSAGLFLQGLQLRLEFITRDVAHEPRLMPEQDARALGPASGATSAAAHLGSPIHAP